MTEDSKVPCGSFGKGVSESLYVDLKHGEQRNQDLDCTGVGMPAL